MKFKKFYKKKKILITGITGFKGSWLATWLIILGSKVYGIGYQPNQNKKLFYSLKLQKKIKLSTFDIRDYKKLESRIKKIKPSIIFHLAAQPLIHYSYQNPYDTFDINFKGTLNIMEITRKYKFIKSVVIVTSDKCYESNNSTKGFKESDRLGGIDPYSASKASAELLVNAYRKSFFNDKNLKVGISTGRAGNVIGGGDWSNKRLIPDAIRSLIKNTKIIVRNPNFNRPWQHVLEPLKGYLILAMKQYYNPRKYSGAWNFGTKAKSITTVKEIIKYIIEFWGTGKKVILKRTKLYEQVNLQLNIVKAQKNLRWTPTYNIKESVFFTVDWYKKVNIFFNSTYSTTVNQITKYMNDSKIN